MGSGRLLSAVVAFGILAIAPPGVSSRQSLVQPGGSQPVPDRRLAALIKTLDRFIAGEKDHAALAILLRLRRQLPGLPDPKRPPPTDKDFRYQLDPPAPLPPLPPPDLQAPLDQADDCWLMDNYKKALAYVDQAVGAADEGLRRADKDLGWVAAAQDALTAQITELVVVGAAESQPLGEIGQSGVSSAPHLHLKTSSVALFSGWERAMIQDTLDFRVEVGEISKPVTEAGHELNRILAAQDYRLQSEDQRGEFRRRVAAAAAEALARHDRVLRIFDVILAGAESFRGLFQPGTVICDSLGNSKYAPEVLEKLKPALRFYEDEMEAARRPWLTVFAWIGPRLFTFTLGR